MEDFQGELKKQLGLLQANTQGLVNEDDLKLCAYCKTKEAKRICISKDYYSYVEDFCSRSCKTLSGRNGVGYDIGASKLLPKRYWKSRFSNFIPKTDSQKKAIKTLKGIQPGFAENVYLYGGAGSGKTHLACSLFELSLKDPRVFNFTTTTDLLLELRSSYSEKSKESDLEVIDRYINYGVLVMDDIGAEKVTDFVAQSWYKIINSRYNEVKPTIFTSNLDLNEISKFFGDRIASRIASGIVIKLDGEDMRLGV